MTKGRAKQGRMRNTEIKARSEKETRIEEIRLDRKANGRINEGRQRETRYVEM
jgi:hypothetical protein